MQFFRFGNFIFFWALVAAAASPLIAREPGKPGDELLARRVDAGNVQPRWRPLGDILPRTAAPAGGNGVLCLGVESAAVVRFNGTQAALANGAPNGLHIENARVTRWNGEMDHLIWRINLPSPGAYALALNRAAAPGEEGLAEITLSGPQRHLLVASIGRSANPNAIEPMEIGEIDLKAGEWVIDFHPSRWSWSPRVFCQLRDLRLIPMDAVRKSSAAAASAIRALGIDAEPDTAALLRRIAADQAEIAQLNQEVRRKDFSAFTDYRQFLEYDRAPARLAAAASELHAASRQLEQLRLKKLAVGSAALAKVNPDDRAKAEAYVKASAEADDQRTRAYPSVGFGPVANEPGHVGEPATLFETGHFEELKDQPIDARGPAVELALQPPPDAPARLAQFQQRDSDAEMAHLCREFQKTLIPGTAGLEQFERLCKEQKPREALEAYRRYFFAKLANPEKYGACTQNILFELTRDRGRSELLRRPSPIVLQRNMNNSQVVKANNELLVGQVGPPGAAAWVPFGLAIPESADREGRIHQDPFWRTPAGRDAARKLEFFRSLNLLPGDRDEYYGGGMFPALLWSYAITGDKAALARWCAYLDDWAIHSTADREAFPHATPWAVELEPQFVRCTLNLMRIVLDERKEFASDFDAPTLARLMMKLATDYAPYMIRARRAEMANWGIMGLCHQQHICRFLHEFKAMDYFNRETWRLWNANMIQHRTLDGENIESWDDGHNWIDIDYSRESIPFAQLPTGVDALDLASFWDDVRTDARSKLVHVSPGGNYWPFWEAEQPRAKTSLRTRYVPDGAGNTFFDLVDQEAAVQTRLRTLMGGAVPEETRPGAQPSDVSPYAAMYYLREGWKPDAEYLLMQNFRDRSQAQEDCSRTMYTLSKADRVLVEAHGLVVDGKPDNRYFGKPATGGKTEYCGQAGRHTFNERFHTSSGFDFAEARQDAPYAHHRRSASDPYGLYKRAIPGGDPEPVTDVTCLRQAFNIRGAGVWLICDRIQSPGPREHEYTQFFSLPVRLNEAGLADRLRVLSSAGVSLYDVNEAAGRIRTNNPGFDNLSLYCFAPAPLKFANVLDDKGSHVASKTSAADAMRQLLASGKTPMQIARMHAIQPVSTRWSGTGNQVFVTALCTRPPSDDPARAFNDDVREIERTTGAGGVVGCRAVGRSGAEIWFASGPQEINRLACGPVIADGESLLVVRKPGGATSGILLGGRTFSAGGKTALLPTADMEFELGPGGDLRNPVDIRRPIDTVRILPEQAVFTDSINVSFDIPTQRIDDIEFHYTLDGSDPTLASPVYTAPFPLKRTALVKVRPFRKGLGQTPWNFTGTDSGKTIAAIFRKEALRPPVTLEKSEPGLAYRYFEGSWTTLFSYAGSDGVLDPKSAGTTASLLNPADLAQLRRTEHAYAVRYDGYVVVPSSGVYTIYAPIHLYTPTMDAGYDLRVWIDGEEWFPNPRLHSENAWSIPLAAGPHRFAASYVDYRDRAFRNEYWMAWQEEEMWKGTPVLEVSGPNTPRQPLPAGWQRR